MENAIVKTVTGIAHPDKGTIRWVKVEESQADSISNHGGSLLEVIEGLTERQMVATFGRSTMGACEPEKGYGDEWWFWNGSKNPKTSVVFKVYSRFGEFRIGGSSNHKRFKADLLSALHSGK